MASKNDEKENTYGDFAAALDILPDLIIFNCNFSSYP